VIQVQVPEKSSTNRELESKIEKSLKKWKVKISLNFKILSLKATFILHYLDLLNLTLKLLQTLEDEN
jgi:hypothetical protein